MTFRNWLIRSQLAWAETQHTISRAVRPRRATSQPMVMQLENRVLLSVAPAAVMADADLAALDGDAEIIEQTEAELSDTNLTEVTAADHATSDAGSSDPSDGSNDPLSTEADTSLRREIVFIDRSVEDQATLLDHLRQTNDTLEREVIALDSQTDGVAQITRALQDRSQIDAVHIVSHAEDGGVQLGSTWLNHDSLDRYSDGLIAWNSVLTDEADLLFYGCDLAATEQGQELVNAIALLTGADVAASIDGTGHVDLGGDWELEQASGEIETASAFDSQIQQNWAHLLADEDSDWFSNYVDTNFTGQDTLEDAYTGGVQSVSAESIWTHGSLTSIAVGFRTVERTKTWIEIDGTPVTSTDERSTWVHLHHVTGLDTDTEYGLDICDATGTLETVIVSTETPAGYIALSSGGQDLTTAGATYILTQDIDADTFGFNIKAANITLDLNGYTLTYDNATPDLSGVSYNHYFNDYTASMGVHLFWGRPANATIINGTIKQGTQQTRGDNGTGFNTIFTESPGTTIAGIVNDWGGDEVGGIYTRAYPDAYIHHCVFKDRGTVVENRYVPHCAAIGPTNKQSTGTIQYTHTGGTYERQVEITGATWPTNASHWVLWIGDNAFKVASRISDTIITLEADSNPGSDIAAGTSYHLYLQNIDNAWHDNLVLRARHCGLSAAVEMRNNEVYVDSFAVNSFAIVPQMMDSRDNYVMGTGYHVVALAYGKTTENNFVWLHAFVNSRDDEYSARGSMWGYRMSQLADNPLDYTDTIIDGNTFILTGDGTAVQLRGTGISQHSRITGTIVRNNKFHIANLGQPGNELTCVAIHGLNDTWPGGGADNAALTIYENNVFASEGACVTLTDSYGSGSNVRYIGNTFTDLGGGDFHIVHAVWTTLDAKYHYFLNNTFSGDENILDPYFGSFTQTTTTREYYVGTTDGETDTLTHHVYAGPGDAELQVVELSFDAFSDTFDEYSESALPAAWSSWDSIGDGTFTVVDRSAESLASPSSPNMVSTKGQRHCRAWLTDREADTDSEVSVTVQVASASVNYSEVFARASGHDAAVEELPVAFTIDAEPPAPAGVPVMEDAADDQAEEAEAEVAESTSESNPAQPVAETQKSRSTDTAVARSKRHTSGNAVADNATRDLPTSDWMLPTQDHEDTSFLHLSREQVIVGSAVAATTALSAGFAFRVLRV